MNYYIEDITLLCLIQIKRGGLILKKEKTKQEKKKLPGIGTATVFAKNLYENNIGTRALERAGKNKNLKGHVFEQLTVDKINRNPSNILKGKKAVLTKSPTAVRDDVIIKQGGKVVKRMQLKDTPRGIKDTVNRVANKQYARTNLVGTKETVKAYTNEVVKRGTEGTKITQKMATNGISSAQTEVIAAKALGGSVVKSSGKIVHQASKVGMQTAVVSAGVGAVVNAGQVLNGNKSVREAVADVTKNAAIDAVSAGIGDSVATATTIAVACTLAAPLAGPVGIAAGVATSMVTENIVRNVDYDAVKKGIRNSNRDIKMSGT